MIIITQAVVYEKELSLPKYNFMPTLISLILSYKYLLLFPLAVVEGPFLMMICGFLVKLGYLNPVFTYTLVMTGDLLGDILWYGVGYKFGMIFVKRFGKFFSITEESLIKVKDIFHRHNSTIIFLSKITMGLGFALATLITAGLVKIPLKKFIFWNALGGLVWTGSLMMVGFYLGNFYLKVDNVLGKLGVLSLFVVVFIMLMGITQYARNQLLTKDSL